MSCNLLWLCKALLVLCQDQKLRPGHVTWANSMDPCFRSAFPCPRASCSGPDASSATYPYSAASTSPPEPYSKHAVRHCTLRTRLAQRPPIGRTGLACIPRRVPSELSLPICSASLEDRIQVVNRNRIEREGEALHLQER
jgi:hypothetical protein